MADFKFRKDAEEWFNHISNRAPLSTKFDLYYLCLLAGIAGQHFSPPKDAQGFVDHFIEDYTSVSHLLMGLIILAEMKRWGIELQNRHDLSKLIDQLLCPSGLSNDGVAICDSYASGGFELLIAEFPRPYSLEEFLPRYQAFLLKLYASASLPKFIKEESKDT